MSAIHFVVPGDPQTRTGGYIYDKRIVRGLRGMARAVAVHALRGPFPQADADARDDAARVFASVPDGAVVVVDGLALGMLPELAARVTERLRLVALVHHPLAYETGLGEAARAERFESERAALACARRIIVTSRTTAALLGDYGAAPARIGVVEPGTDPAPVAVGSRGPGLNLLCVATLTPRKGHAVLIDALARLKDRDWRLTCAGGAHFDAACARDIRNRIAAHGLGQRVELVGEVGPAKLSDLYGTADALVLASFFEGYGVVLSEALARGLPIISTTGGAIPATVPAGAGLLVEPGHRGKLAAALQRACDDPSLLPRLGAAARRARAGLASWSTAAARFNAELERAP